MPRSEQMTPVDISWLRMDRPTNRVVVVSVTILADTVDLARLERTLAARLLVYPRFRQRIERTLTAYRWSVDPAFDISRHIKRVRLPGAGGKPALQRLVAELASLAMDEAHPLWQIHIVEAYEGGTAIIWRSHHALADGMALVQVLLSLTDDHADAPEGRPASALLPRETEQPWPALLRPMAAVVTGSVRTYAAAWRSFGEMVLNPAKALDYARDGSGIVRELAYLLLMRPNSSTRFKGKPKGQKRVAWTDPIPLPEVKAVGHALGCSVNDLLLASIAGALRVYLAQKGDDTAGVELRAVVPVNLRTPGSELALGNQFGVVGIELPIGIENPLERLYEIRRRMAELKKSYEPSVTLGLFAALGYTPQLVQDQVLDLLSSRFTAVMSNVPGPQHPLFIAGARVKQMMFWVPQFGELGMGGSILSLDGQVQFGLMTDAALVPDPEMIIGHVRTEFDKLLYFVLREIDIPSAPEPTEGEPAPIA